MEMQEFIAGINLIEKITSKAKLTRTVSMPMIRIFLYIATHPACTQKDIQEDLKIPAGSMSACLRALASGGSTSTIRKDGYNLIKEMLSFEDYRQKEYFLSDKGMKLIADIKDL